MLGLSLFQQRLPWISHSIFSLHLDFGLFTMSLDCNPLAVHKNDHPPLSKMLHTNPPLQKKKVHLLLNQQDKLSKNSMNKPYLSLHRSPFQILKCASSIRKSGFPHFLLLFPPPEIPVSLPGCSGQLARSNQSSAVNACQPCPCSRSLWAPNPEFVIH